MNNYKTGPCDHYAGQKQNTASTKEPRWSPSDPSPVATRGNLHPDFLKDPSLALHLFFTFLYSSHLYTI